MSAQHRFDGNVSDVKGENEDDGVDKCFRKSGPTALKRVLGDLRKGERQTFDWRLVFIITEEGH